MGQGAPAAALAQAVEDRLDHPALGVLGAGSAWVGTRENRRDHGPLRVAQIAGIAHAEEPTTTSLPRQTF